MKNKFIKLVLSSFCIFSLVGCGSEDKQATSDVPSVVPSVSTSESTSSPSSQECTTPYTVTYYLNDGSDKVYHTETVNYGHKINRPTNPERDGYVFAGWFVDSECLVNFKLSTLIKADTSLYARWLEKTTPSTSEPEPSLPDSSETDSTLPDSSTPVDPSTPEGEMITYSIEKLPDWITKDGCVIFAWVWSPSNNGSWVETTFDTSDPTNIKASFQVEDELTGMLLARCAAGTTTPDWNEKGNVPGKVYNKTQDITIEAGVTTYECSKWVNA